MEKLGARDECQATAQIVERGSTVSVLPGFQDMTGYKLVQPHSRPCCEQEIGPETPWDPFQPELYYGPTEHTDIFWMYRVGWNVGKILQIKSVGASNNCNSCNKIQIKYVGISCLSWSSPQPLKNNCLNRFQSKARFHLQNERRGGLERSTQ